MRENKFEKSHIHIMKSETLSRESRITESTKECQFNSLRNALGTPIFTSCQRFYTLCEEEGRRIERRMSRCFTWFPDCLILGKPNI